MPVFRWARTTASAATASASSSPQPLPSREKVLEKRSRKPSGTELGVVHDLAEKRAVGADAGDCLFRERALHALDGGITRRRPRRQLGEQRIVIERHCPTLRRSPESSRMPGPAGSVSRVICPGEGIN